MYYIILNINYLWGKCDIYSMVHSHFMVLLSVLKMRRTEKMNDIFKYDTGYEYLKFIRSQKTRALFLENIEAAESLTSFYEEIEDLPKAKKWAKTTKELLEKSKNKKDYSETLDYVNEILEQR